MDMRAQTKDSRGDLIPVLVAAIVAIMGTAGILFSDFGPDTNSQGSGNGMITAAAVGRAGAIELPSQSLVGRPVRSDKQFQNLMRPS